jgi:hypothetical protein
MTTCQVDKAGTAKAKPKYYTQVGLNDILLGRGAPIINNEGNKRFRNLIIERKKRYITLCKHQDKNDIVYEIINIIISREGLFLKKIDDKSRRSTLGFDAWEEADDSTIIQKVKQALRENENRYQGAGHLSTHSSTVPKVNELSKKLSFDTTDALSRQLSTTGLPLATPTLHSDTLAQYLTNITNRAISMQHHEGFSSRTVQSVEKLLQSVLQQIQSSTHSRSLQIHGTAYNPLDQRLNEMKPLLLWLGSSNILANRAKALQQHEGFLSGTIQSIQNLIQPPLQQIQSDVHSRSLPIHEKYFHSADQRMNELKLLALWLDSSPTMDDNKRILEHLLLEQHNLLNLLSRVCQLAKLVRQLDTSLNPIQNQGSNVDVSLLNAAILNGKRY